MLVWSTYKLYDLHTVFLFQIISFKEYFYVSLGNNVCYCFFVEAHYLQRPLGNCPVPPPLKSGPDKLSCRLSEADGCADGSTD